MPDKVWLTWVHHKARRPLFPSVRRAGLTDRSPRGTARFILPRSVSSSECFCFSSLSSRFHGLLTDQGFFPSSRYHFSAATFTRVPIASLGSDPRLSQPHAGLLRPEACRLISSRNHVQGSSVQGLLPPHVHPLSSRGAAPMPLLLSHFSSASTGSHR